MDNDALSPLLRCYESQTKSWSTEDREENDTFGTWAALEGYRHREELYNDHDPENGECEEATRGISYVCTVQRRFNALRSDKPEGDEAVYCRGFRLGMQGCIPGKTIDGRPVPMRYCHEVGCPTCWIAARHEACRLLGGLDVPIIQLRFTDIIPLDRAIEVDIRNAVCGSGKGQNWSPLFTQIVIGVQAGDKEAEPGLRYAGLFVPNPSTTRGQPRNMRGWNFREQYGQESCYEKVVDLESCPIRVTCLAYSNEFPSDANEHDLNTTLVMNKWWDIAFPPVLLYRHPYFTSTSILADWLERADKASQGESGKRHRIGIQVKTAEAYQGNAGERGYFVPAPLHVTPEWLCDISADEELDIGMEREDPSRPSYPSVSTVPTPTLPLRKQPLHIPWIDNPCFNGEGPIWGSAAALIGQQGAGKTSLGLLMCMAQAAAGKKATFVSDASESGDSVMRRIRKYAQYMNADKIRWNSNNTLLNIEQNLRYEVWDPRMNRDLNEFIVNAISLHETQLLCLDGIDGLIASSTQHQQRERVALEIAQVAADCANNSGTFIVIGAQLHPKKIMDQPFGIDISDADAAISPKLCHSLRYCFVLGPLSENRRTFGIARSIDGERIQGDDRLVLESSEYGYLSQSERAHLRGSNIIFSE